MSVEGENANEKEETRRKKLVSVVEKDIFHQEKIRNIVVKNVNEKLTMKDRKTESMNIHAYIVGKIFLEK